MRIIQHIVDFLYPPFCLHCDSPLEYQTKLLCTECLPSMELINAEERCCCCFSPEISGEKKKCLSCLQDSPVWERAAAALDYHGPAVTIVRAMKYGNQPYLAKGAAAWMASQLHDLNWPFPDVIVPVPIPITRWIQRGYNQSLCLAKSLGEIIDRPVCSALKRRCGDYSQAGLSSKERKKLSSASFSLVKRVDLEDKTILLVDDVMTTGTTLKCCAEVLLEGFPKKIYTLTVCRAIQ